MPIEQYRGGMFRTEAKSELRRGRFPNASPNPDFDFQRPLNEITISKSLSARESDLFQRMTVDGPIKSFAVFMQTVEGVIIKQELSVSLHEINPTHLALVDFYRRTIVDMDRYIDDHREEFINSMNMGGDEFFNAVQGIGITRVGDPIFTVGEAFDVFRKSINDEKIYPNPRSRQLLKQDLGDFENFAVKDVFRTHEINPSVLLVALKRKG